MNDSSDGAGSKASTTGLSEGCVARREVRTERRAGLDSEAGIQCVSHLVCVTEYEL